MLTRSPFLIWCETGKIHPGDRIISCNGVEFSACTHAEAIATIRDSGDNLTFVLESAIPELKAASEPKPSAEMIELQGRLAEAEAEISRRIASEAAMTAAAAAAAAAAAKAVEEAEVRGAEEERARAAAVKEAEDAATAAEAAMVKEAAAAAARANPGSKLRPRTKSSRWERSAVELGLPQNGVQDQSDLVFSP